MRVTIGQLVRRPPEQLIDRVVAGPLPKALTQIRDPGKDEHALRPDHRIGPRGTTTQAMACRGPERQMAAGGMADRKQTSEVEWMPRGE